MSRFIQLFCCDMASKLPFHGVLGFPQKKILLFLKRETRLGLARSEEVVYNVSTIKKVVYEPTQQISKKRIDTLEKFFFFIESCHDWLIIAFISFLRTD